MERFYYHSSISDFIAEDTNAILGKLASADSFSVESDQMNAWIGEVDLLKRKLGDLTGDIIFEYSIPRLENALM